MKNDDGVEEREDRIARPIASYIVRVWPSADESIRGVAKHVQTGVEIPFADGKALVEILNPKTQTKEDNEDTEK